MRAFALLSIKYLYIYGDSKLVVNQGIDMYNTKDKKLFPYPTNNRYVYAIENILRTNNRYVYTMASIVSLMPIIEIEDEETILKILKNGYNVLYSLIWGSRGILY